MKDHLYPFYYLPMKYYVRVRPGTVVSSLNVSTYLPAVSEIF